MSGSLNKVMLIGHLGDDIKMHYFDGGGCVGRFSLATNETYTDKSSGEKVTNTDWHNILVRNKAAEICQKYLSKGDKVYLEGRLKTRKWTAENGQDRYTTEVNVDEFTFLNTSKVKEVSTEESPVPKSNQDTKDIPCLLYTSPSPRDRG